MTPLRPSRSIATTAIVALLTLVFPYLPPKAQLNGVAPFLYYYSKAQSSFVVEKADGRNSRILTKFTLTEKIPGQEVQAIITGPGWSPSGNWFAWRETTNYGGPSIGYIVSRDGSKQLSLLNGLLIAHMEWSPTKDLWMAMVRLHDSEPFTYDIYISLTCMPLRFPGVSLLM